MPSTPDGEAEAAAAVADASVAVTGEAAFGAAWGAAARGILPSRNAASVGMLE